MSIFERSISPEFKHSVSEKFIGQLEQEKAKGGWWKDVLDDSKLIIALRGSYLNVYWRGQSLFYVESSSSGLKVTTHEKYLLDPALAAQVSLTDGSFDVASLVENGFLRRYEGPATLAKMKKAAGLFAKVEKTGCHEIAVHNPGVIDCEIAFPGTVSSGDGGSVKTAPRADLATLESDGGDVRLVFWEAKDYSNDELRADDGLPPVCNQVKTYQKILSKNRDAIEKYYPRVANNLVEIHSMKWARPLSQLIKDIGSGQRRLTLGDEPKVGLIIFGFDECQRDCPRWQSHLRKLKGEITHVLAVGKAKELRLPE